MKAKTLAFSITALAVLSGSISAAPSPLGTAFTYQGRLTANGSGNPLDG